MYRDLLRRQASFHSARVSRTLGLAWSRRASPTPIPRVWGCVRTPLVRRPRHECIKASVNTSYQGHLLPGAWFRGSLATALPVLCARRRPLPNPPESRALSYSSSHLTFCEGPSPATTSSPGSLVSSVVRHRAGGDSVL